MSKVSELLAKLRDDEISLPEVETEFLRLSWATGPKKPKTYQELVVAEESDPPLLVEGSFDEVSAAYNAGTLSEAEYLVLSRAAARRTN